jgi:UDP-N-acetylglucosamine 2-epimerase (non-hydrolysing)
VLTVTDSGGIQEEAPSFGAPVLVLRDVTERPEAVEAGVARLVGTSRERITSAAAELLGAPTRPARMANPYGDGRAGERIADVVVHRLTGAPRTTGDWQP